jgi:hypothetical protein
MGTHVAHLDLTRWVRLAPRVERAFWSTDRAWPSDALTLTVETRWVPDGTEVRLEVRHSDADPGEPAIETIDGLSVAGNRARIEHALAWDPDLVADALMLADRRPWFRFDVVIDRYRIVAPSTLLYVPLEALVPSH